MVAFLWMQMLVIMCGRRDKHLLICHSKSEKRIFQKKMKKAILYILILIAVCKSVYAQKADYNSSVRLINIYLNAVGNYGNAGQVLIAEGNKILINKSYGYAIRESKTVTTNETIFELASTSKMFTAIAILKLEMQGKLSVNDSISEFFSEVPKEKKGITIHQLLTHTSGIAGGDIIDDFQTISKQDLINKILTSGLRARPGQKFMYSNAGFNLLAAIIEKISGKEYGEYLSDIIFKPTGMKHSSVNGSKKLLDVKVAYAYNGITPNGGPNNQLFNARTWGGGSICSTASDLWLLKHALDGNELLSMEAKEKMFKVQFKISDDNNYGYGCFVYTSNGEKIIDFIGETERGFNCTFRNYVDDSKTFISLSNASQPNERHNRWFLDAHVKNLWQESRHFHFPPATKELTDKTLCQYTGTYKFDKNIIKVIKQGNNLVVEADGVEATSLLFSLSGIRNTKVAAVEQKVSQLMAAYFTQTNDAFKDILSEGNNPDFADERDKLIEKFGPLKSYRVKGIYPDRDSNFMVATLVLDFGNKKIPYFSMWNLIDMNKIQLDYYAPETNTTIAKIFSNIKADEFVSYNFFKDEVDTKFNFLRVNGKIGSLTNKSQNIKFKKN